MLQVLEKKKADIKDETSNKTNESETSGMFTEFELIKVDAWRFCKIKSVKLVTSTVKLC